MSAVNVQKKNLGSSAEKDCLVQTMNRSWTLPLVLVLSLQTSTILGGRAQRRQREAEDSLKPYLGRVDPVPKGECTEEEFGQFPYRVLDWFLLLSRMGGSYPSAAVPPQTCISHGQRLQLAQVLQTKHDHKANRNRWGCDWRNIKELVNVAREREVWGPLLELLPPRPDPG
ncbi:unnamed protein product [Boreogadus saida]